MKKDTPTPAVHWVDEFLVPLGACFAEEYRQYPDAQTAWEKCENLSHLLWMLDKTQVCDVRTFRLMACDFAEHVLHVFEEQRPNDSRPRDAIAASRAYAKSPTEANRLKMAAAEDAAKNAARDAAWDAAWAAGRAAAWAAARTDAWDVARTDAWDVEMDVTKATARAAARAVGMAAENRWQCDCIRKYFPKSPFVGAAIKKAKGETE